MYAYIGCNLNITLLEGVLKNKQKVASGSNITLVHNKGKSHSDLSDNVSRDLISIKIQLYRGE